MQLSRSQLLRTDAVIQAIGLVLLIFQFHLLNGDSVDSDSDTAQFLLLGLQMASAVCFLAWSEPRQTFAKGRSILLALFVIAIFLSFFGEVVVLILKLISLGMADVSFDPGLRRWVLFLLQTAYFGLTLKDAWRKGSMNVAAPSTATLSEFDTHLSVEPSAPPKPPSAVAVKFLEGAKRTIPWLRFLIPTILLIAALNAFVVDFGYQLAGEEWTPLILCLITLLVGWLFSLKSKRSDLGKLYAGWSRLWWIAALPVMVILLCTLPPIRSQLNQRDHASAPEWKSFYGPLGLAQRRELYMEEHRDRLLIQPGVVENRLAKYEAQMSPYTELWDDRHELTLYVAAMRLRGESWEQIARRPIGRHLITATLLAEAAPPYWQQKAGWIFRDLHAAPKGSFTLGLVPQEWAKENVSAWCTPDVSGPGLTREACDNYAPSTLESESAWRAHGRASCLVRGLLQVAAEHHGILTESAIEQLLAQLKQFAAPTESLPALEAAMAARVQFRAWATPHAGHDRKLPLEFVFDEARFPYKTARDWVGKKFSNFVRICGFDPVSPTALASAPVISLTLEPRKFDHVAITNQTTEERTRPETSRQMSGSQGGNYYSKTTVSTERRTFVQEHLGSLTVPSLVVSFGDQRIALPPSAEVRAADSGRVLDSLQKGKFPPSTDTSAVINLYYHCHDVAARPWAFGLSYELNSAPQLRVDGWRDIEPESPIWE